MAQGRLLNHGEHKGCGGAFYIGMSGQWSRVRGKVVVHGVGERSTGGGVCCAYQ